MDEMDTDYAEKLMKMGETDKAGVVALIAVADFLGAIAANLDYLTEWLTSEDEDE